MQALPLPALGGKTKQHDTAQSVKQMCKTYKATTEKLLYAFAALSNQNDQIKTHKKTVQLAMNESATKMLLNNISGALATSISQVVDSKDLALRNTVISDLRMRFKPPDPPAKVDASAQAALSPLRAPQTSVSDQNPKSEVVDMSKEKENELTRPVVSTLRSGPSDAVYDRMKVWQARKNAKLQLQAQAKEKEVVRKLQPLRARPNDKYAHVVSVLQRERQAASNARVAEAEKKSVVSEQRAQEAEAKAEFEREERARMQALMDQALIMQEEAKQALQNAKQEQEEAESKLEKLQAEVDRDTKKRAEIAEIKQALGGRKLETWPMVPNKRVLRVQPTDDFDGRVSSEFRVRDEKTERGVSFLMGRSVVTQRPEVQCVLFDPRHFSELQAARWWSENCHRFSKTT